MVGCCPTYAEVGDVFPGKRIYAHYLEAMQMATPDDYRRKIADLGLLGKGGLTLGANTAAEAKQLLPKIRQLQAELRALKKEINLEVKTIRMRYQQQMPAAGAGTSTVFSLFGKRKVAGSIRADAKRQLAAKRDREIGGYEQVKATIDDLLLQLDRAKVTVQQYIADHTK